MNLLSKIENIAKDIFFEYGYVEIKNLKFYEEVRTLCKKKYLSELRNIVGLPTGNRYTFAM